MSATILSLAVSAAMYVLGMAIAWVIDRRTGNAGWVDVMWTLSLSLSALAGVAAHIWLGTDVALAPALVALGLVALWASRLAGYLFSRSAGIADDPRYRKMREEWGDRAPVMMALALQLQAILSLPLVHSVLMAATVPGPAASWGTGLGAGVALFGLWIGWKADRDLAAFKRTQSGLCTTGLWGLSRHPNYVGEILFWVGIALLSAGHGLAGLAAGVGPLTIYLLLRYFSGIPPLEAHMLEKHGAAYEAYQASTPPLFPRPWGARRHV